jgi:hypothetical protein
MVWPVWRICVTADDRWAMPLATLGQPKRFYKMLTERKKQKRREALIRNHVKQYSANEVVTYVDIEEGFNELSREAFALWIRMHTLPENFFGRRELGRIFNRQDYCTNLTIDKLRLADYLLVESPGRPLVVRFRLLKRAKLPRHSLFVILDPKAMDRVSK